MVGAILILLLLPILHTSQIRSSSFRPLQKKLFWIFVADVLLLGWIGGQPVEDPYVFVGQIATIFYFSYFIIIIPLVGYIENTLVKLYYLNYVDTQNEIELNKIINSNLIKI